MRLGRWIVAILLLLLAGLPAFPPLVTQVLQEGLKAANFTGQWQAVEGYLLGGLELRGVRLEGPGVRLEAQRLRVSYDLLALWRRELPLRIVLDDGDIFLSWEAIIPEGDQPGTPAPLALRLEQLQLNRVGFQIEQSQRFFLPTLRATVRGSNPYQIALVLPDGRLSAIARRTGREFEAWQIELKGDLRAARFWFDGIESGQLEGSWTIGPGVRNGILGKNQVKNATLRIVGFTLSQISGSIGFDGKTVSADLVGRGLDGPLKGSATVDLPNQEYRFRVEGKPTLPALAQNFGLRLPLSGGGPLVLEGRGWQNLVLRGRYSGEGRLLGEPLAYQGTLAFDEAFRLDAEVEGAFFDRDFQATLSLRNDAYTLRLRDSRQSSLRLVGKGPNTQAEGTLVWPRPLLGKAALRFSSSGPRWSLRVQSEQVALPAAKPFSLSGTLEGQGIAVRGRLGALDLGGTWEDLRMRLSGLELLVGQLSGQARLRAGRFSGEFSYDSPYARFPLLLVQDGSVWRLSNRWASGVYRDGVFTLAVRGLPVQILDSFQLSGDVRYQQDRLSGSWSLRGERGWVKGELYDLATRYRGEVRTPLGVLPLSGSADATGLQAQLETLAITADGSNGLLLKGPLRLGPQLYLEADLGLQGGLYKGQVRFETPWLWGRLEGRGATLWLTASGYAQLSGPLWPDTSLKGRLTLPRSGLVEVPPVDLEVSRSEVRWPGGRVRLEAGLPFEGTLPLQVNQEPGSVELRGNLERGSIELRTPYGTVNAEGAWRSLSVMGSLRYAGYEGQLMGQVDVPNLAYQGRLLLPELEGGLEFRGRGTALSYAGRFQNGRLTLAGDYQPDRAPEGLRLRLIASNYDLRRWGVPGILTGRWSEQGGRLLLKTPFGQAQMSGAGLLGPVNLQFQSPYGVLRGQLSSEAVDLQGSLELPYLSGSLLVRGPWNNLEAQGQGRYNLPYLEPAPWRFSADVSQQTWKLEGPLALQGKGLVYQGSLSWPYRWLGKVGVLQGGLAGEGLAVQASLRTSIAGLPLSATLKAEGAGLSRLQADLALPEGKVQLVGQQVVFDLEAAPIAAIWEANVQGRLSGRLDLSSLSRSSQGSIPVPDGEALGQLQVYGQRLELDYKNRSLSAFLPEYGVGVVLELEPGREPELIGTGDLEGLLRLGERLEGRLVYRVPGLDLEAEIMGSRLGPEFLLQAQADAFKVLARGSYDLSQAQGRAQLQLESGYIQAGLEFSSAGSRYQAIGQAISLQYLRQSGPLRLSGEGSSWKLTWAAPMRVEAQGQATLLESLRLAGQGSLELAERRLDLSGSLALEGGVFSGQMQARGEQIALELMGAGDRLVAQGSVFGVYLEAQTNRQGDLGGQVSYVRTLGPSTLQARGSLGGTLLEPALRGEGSLAGRGASVSFRFGYGVPPPWNEPAASGPREPAGFLSALWAQAEGAGLSLRLFQGELKLSMDSDLEPFLGLPLHLQAEGEGPWASLRLPITLRGPNLEARGVVVPARVQAQLAGRYEQQRFDLSYDGVLQMRLDGPYARGTARWVSNAPSGVLQLELPLPGGGLVGQADLDAGQVVLRGREGWRGDLRAQLREGWSQPSRWQLEADIESPLPSQSTPLRLQGRFALDVAPLALQGEGLLQLPEWGAVGLSARGSDVELRGLAELAPLRGRIQLDPLQLSWSYVGALPRGLGQLEARGAYPGRWLSGRYQVADQTLDLEGQGARLRVWASGLEAALSADRLEAQLEEYNLSGLRLSGRVTGPWNALGADLKWDAFGRKGLLKATWQQGQLQASLSGDVEGTLRYAEAWSGGLRFSEGYLELSGSGIPLVEGEVLGLGLRLRYPILQVAVSRESLKQAGGLTLNLVERSAAGELELQNLELRGRGLLLEAVYPFAGGRLLANADLQTLALRLEAPELGSGVLQFKEGQLDGGLNLSAYGLEVTLEGMGAKASLRVTHPETPWLPWESGVLVGQIGLDGGWQLSYQDAERKQQLEAQGRLLEAAVSAKGPWAEGQLKLAAGDWQGRLQLDLALKPLSSRLELLLEGRQTLVAMGTLSGDVGNLEVRGELAQDGLRARAGFKDLALSEIPQVASRLPFLKGRASGAVEYSMGRLEFSLSSPGLQVKGDDLALAARAEGTFNDGLLQAQISLERADQPGNSSLGFNRTTASVRLENGIISGQATAASFPLHWLFSTWAGDLAGQAFWTGRVSFSYNTRDPWSSRGIWVGEHLRFQGGGDTLVGTAVLRFEQERLYIDQLGLTGKGTWTGSGYYGRRGSNLRLSLENTSFTPVLQVVPNLKPLVPEGSGTLRLAISGESFDLTLENFAFKLGPVRAETPRVVLRVGNTTTAEGRIRLTAPYPAEAQLSGEGDLSGFTVRAKGSASLPLLSPNEPFDLSFSYPAYAVDARLQRQDARLYGTLFPQLILTLQGQVPVSYPQYFLLEGLLETNLILRYQRGTYIVQGAANVIRARLGFPEGQREVVLAPPTEGASRPADAVPVEFANVQLRASRGILIQESLAQGELAGEVFLNGNLANPFLSGEVVPLRGSFKLWDRDFTIKDRSPEERSYARFSPANGILPDINIVAETQVQDRAQDNQRIQINLTLKGEFVRQNGRIKLSLTPTFIARQNGEIARKNDGQPYSDAEIYALLLLGRSDLSALPSDIAQTGLQAVVQNFIVGQLERELAKALGLDQVRVEIPVLNGGTIEETRFTIGRYLLPELFFAYSVDLRGKQAFSAEYQQGDFRLRVNTEVFPQPRPEISFAWTIRPIGADLSIDLATGVGDMFRNDGVRFGIGLNFRF